MKIIHFNEECLSFITPIAIQANFNMLNEVCFYYWSKCSTIPQDDNIIVIWRLKKKES